MNAPLERAVLYIDGNNWYHFCADIGVRNPFDLCYAKISRKLILNREWVETRYYIGALKQELGKQRYAAQRAFLDKLVNTDKRISRHLGRIETRPQPNPAIPNLRQYVENPTTLMPDETRSFFLRVLEHYSTVQVEKEKAVDVMVARDMIVGALDDHFDVAFLLSADGDFTPVVETIRERGKKVICASPGFSSQLQKAANTFIPLKKGWFDDCYT